MNIEDTPSNIQQNKVIPNFILLFLLALRMLDHYLPDILFPQEIPEWFGYYYLFSLYTLTILLLWVNKNDLKAYNIDKPSYNLLLGGGIVLFVISPDELPAIILFMVVLFFYWANFKTFIYTNSGPRYSWWILLIFIIVAGLGWLPVLIYSAHIRSPLDSDAITYAFFRASLPGIVFEEFLFRGFLWGYLRNKGIGEWVILIIQAIFFGYRIIDSCCSKTLISSGCHFL